VPGASPVRSSTFVRNSAAARPAPRPPPRPARCRCFKTQDLGGSLAAESASDLAGLDAEPSEELFDFCRDIGSLFRHGHEPTTKNGYFAYAGLLTEGWVPEARDGTRGRPGQTG
jgi:hypothetical protein